MRWQGRFYRAVYNPNGTASDDEMDRSLQSPFDNVLWGSRSEFIRLAPEHPESFPKLILIYRIMGSLMAAFAFMIAIAGTIFMLLDLFR